MERTQQFVSLEYALILFCIAEKEWLDAILALEAGQWTSNKALSKLQKKAIERSRAERNLNQCFADFTDNCNTWSSYFAVAETCIEMAMNAATDTTNAASSVPPAYMKDYLLGKTDCLSEMISRYMYFCYHQRTRSQIDNKDYDKTLREFHHSFFYFLKAMHLQSCIKDPYTIKD